MRKNIIIDDPKEKSLIEDLKNRKDIKAERIKKLLALPDLTKKENSPIKILAGQIIKLPRFADFDLVFPPKIVTVNEEFNLLNAPINHPSRKETDTFFIDDIYHLRTQMTVMWSYYLKNPEVLEKLEKDGCIMALAPGIVFRKDEIDKNHFPAFHQIDGLFLCKREQKVITMDDLKEVEIDIAKSVFGKRCCCRHGSRYLSWRQRSRTPGGEGCHWPPAALCTLGCARACPRAFARQQGNPCGSRGIRSTGRPRENSPRRARFIAY